MYCTCTQTFITGTYYSAIKKNKNKQESGIYNKKMK